MTYAQTKERCFSESPYCITGVFLDYWETNGGLPVFGIPITAQGETHDNTNTLAALQLFERERFELHPGNAWPYNVQLGLLGVEILTRQGQDWKKFPKADPKTPHYFKETGHAIDPKFISYWQSHGLEFGDTGVTQRESVALFGYPISPARMETNSSGDTVLTQWFERARFEYHPTNPAAYQVLLGRLGAEAFPGGQGPEGPAPSK